MEQPYIISDEEEPEPQKSVKTTFKKVGDEGAELIFVGVEHANEDAELIFVGMTSNSKPVVSKILNRVTPGSSLGRKKYGHPRRRDTALKLKPVSHVNSASDVEAISPHSVSELRSADSPLIEPLPKPNSQSNLQQVVPNSSSELHLPLTTFSSSLQHPGAALSVGGMNESPLVSKRISISEANCENPKRPKLSDGIVGAHSSVLSPSGIVRSPSAAQQSILSNVDTSLNLVQNGAPLLIALPKDNIYFKPISAVRENRPAKADVLSLVSENKTVDPSKEKLVLLHDYYYGQHKGNEQPEPKTYTVFKCLRCLKVLRNIKFMNHMKHHLEIEKQGGDSWENNTTCEHCHRQFPTAFQLQCHIESVHSSHEPSAVCKICELSFKSDQILLEHMKDNHKPGEMPYVCQVCKYRSSAFAEVETHFRTCHAYTKNLLCPYCLKIFKTGTRYMSHFRGHWENNVHPCSKCRLQFLTYREKIEHKTHFHQMFKKPKQLEGLPPETKIVIQVSLGSLQAASEEEVASITVSTSDFEPSLPNPKSRISKKK
ncbi:zinc finger protein 280B-like isoform X1 [Suncus etruscus]|uniref:zinc finger protein 280B-like isoform X1 n=1 Tax=Suncus etruscus TaxID=109475 RepID=UPI00210FE407|nr:zinc finger protein 280B-like isoform X1 [Suncus etruscus]